MPDDVAALASELHGSPRRVFDVDVWGQRLGRPDGPESLISSARLDAGRLTIRLVDADAPLEPPRGDLVIERPAGVRRHKNGSIDIERAASVTWAGDRYEIFNKDAPAIRFSFV